LLQSSVNSVNSVNSVKYSITKFYIQLLSIAFLLADTHILSTQPLKTRTDILIIGGGASGITAGIQAARLGTRTLIMEEMPWLGGMLTSAGVAAIDGNNRLPSGLWGEFRQKLREHYGTTNLETGWVSNTLFEPRVGDSIWKAMARREEGFLTVQHSFYAVSVKKQGKRIVSVLFKSVDGGQMLDVQANVVIDATELGDVLALAGAKFDVGMESRAMTGEAMAPAKANGIIQDLTYAAILKDYRPQFGDSADRRIPKPNGYDPLQFNTCCRESCYGIPPDSAAKFVDAQTMLNYGRLPTRELLNNGVNAGRGAKYMLNWPRKGNDYYFNGIAMNREERLKGYNEAKQVTMRFVYHIQTTLGFKYLGLADDEFPTPDSLALIPYHREARRMRGAAHMTINHVLKPYSDNLYRTAIAVGDYPVDHHHAKYPRQEEIPQIDFPPVPSFSIPLGSLIPAGSQNIENLIVAEKSISVSNIINGSTRLQPCVMLIGQAAGTLAALSVKGNLMPANVPVRSVQQSLLSAKCWLLPFLDVPPEHPNFEAVQKIGLTGALRGTGVPNKWANQTWFYPDSVALLADVKAALNAVIHGDNDKKIIARETTALTTIWTTTPTAPVFAGMLQKICSLIAQPCALQTSTFTADHALTRAELAQMLQEVFDPFKRINVDIVGNNMKIMKK
jgi:FAD dependent oxidoreductase